MLRKIQNIGDQLKDYTEKLVFSYADIAIYKKVKRNLEASGIPFHEWNIVQMEEFADNQKLIEKYADEILALDTIQDEIATSSDMKGYSSYRRE